MAQFQISVASIFRYCAWWWLVVVIVVVVVVVEDVIVCELEYVHELMN